MYFVFDHLIGVVVGAVILLLLFAFQLRTQDENVDALRSETNRARLVDLVHVVDRDLRNAGSMTDQPGILAWSDAEPAGSSPVTILEFFTTVDTSAAAPVVQLRYDLVRVGEAPVEGQSVPIYELRRMAYDGSAYVLMSASSPTVTAFDLVLLDGSGSPTTEPSAARAFEVHATTVSPFGADRVTTESRWETVIWPVNLNL